MAGTPSTLETLDLNTFWKNQRVLVTGHTGFKGAWLTLWLRQLGANVCGIALEPETKPGLCEQFHLEAEIQHNIVDIRDADKVVECVRSFQPTIVFHLAAQALVRPAYAQPVETWDTNVRGTINLMESLRTLHQPVAAVMVTTDKVYLNREWTHGYRENDPVGGHDPYSSSKAAMEIAVESWRKSFFGNGTQVAIATARAGNVIGGGDFAIDRIVPDIVRSLQAGSPVAVRNPIATRPWQHVLEPLSGYMKLAERLHTAQANKDINDLNTLTSPWNFGPLPEANRTVASLVETALKTWPGTWSNESPQNPPHEATFLGLAIDKAARHLEWYPRWSFAQAVRATMEWYKLRYFEDADPKELATAQIASFENVATESNVGVIRFENRVVRRAA